MSFLRVKWRQYLFTSIRTSVSSNQENHRSQQVCWNQPRRFQTIIAHPGGIHIIQSFLGCIVTLMEDLALEFYISAAYGGEAFQVFQWEMMDESHESFPRCSRCTLTTISVNLTTLSNN